MKIYDVAAGTGRIGISGLPGAGGALAEDVATIGEWGATLVFSMVSDAELDQGNVALLSEMAASHGIDWRHLPVPDFGVPSVTVAAMWTEAAARAHRILDVGGNVLVHCRGGCGRSGMAALRLLVERGEAPDVALARLRTARACAVETEAQFKWAASAGDFTGDWPGPGVQK